MPEPHHRPVDISAVTPGTRVLDRSGETVGTVTLAQPANADMALPPDQDDEGSGGIFETIVDLLSSGEPRVPSHVAVSLERAGYLKIARTGEPGRQDGGHLYASAEDVVSLTDDTVHLRCATGDLVEET